MPPDFCLKATDKFTPSVILTWLRKAAKAGVPDDKWDRAWQHYLDILDWQRANPDKVKVPD